MAVKVLQVGAFALEKGKVADPSPGWGQAGSARSLGANSAFSWLGFSKGPTVNVKEDESITSLAFKDVPRQTGILVEKEISMYGRFTGLDSFNYWIFGFENSVVPVMCCYLSTPTVAPTAGAVYSDGDLSDFTFLRAEGSLYIFRADDSSVETSQTPTLTKSSGTGDATLSVTSHSGLMYEHLYELDAVSRHFTPYLTPEQITGYSAGDKKNRMATLGVKMSSNDFLYKNAMCKGFSLKSTAGGFWEVTLPFLAHEESRGNYSSASWTFPSDRIDSQEIVSHHLTTVQLGTNESTLVALGVTDLDMGVEIPLQVLQDTLSGLYLSEPVLEGKYSASLGMSLSRYSTVTYQDLRDSWSNVVARVSASQGFYLQEFLVQEAKVIAAGPDDSDVAKEPLQLSIGYTTSNNWSAALYGSVLVQNSPIVYRVRNYSASNQMLAQ